MPLAVQSATGAKFAADTLSYTGISRLLRAGRLPIGGMLAR